jgi:hypothetical protein
VSIHVAKRHDVVREEGDLLVVSHGARLGGACVRCAASGELRAHFELLHHGRRWSWLVLPTSLIGLLFPSLSRRAAGVFLPVCPACDAIWRRAARAHAWVVLSLVPVSFVAFGAFALEARGALPADAGAWITLALALAWTAGYVAAHIGRSRRLMVTAASIEREFLSLRGVHPDARRAIVAHSVALRL